MPITGEKYIFSKENVVKAPAAHGVYALYVGNELTYIGRASGIGVTIRSRLLCHQRGDEGPCTASATSYSREVTTTPILRERELLEEFKRIYGRLPRCNARAG
jgi:hypothetical protein